jgi:hypothetical protein
MRRALAAGALLLLAAGAHPPADRVVIAGGPVELARQAAVVASGTLDEAGRLRVERYWKGGGPAILALPAGHGPEGARVAVFMEAVPGRPGTLHPLPLGANGEVGIITMSGERLAPGGERLEDVVAAAAPPRDWRDRLRGGADDPALRQ